MVLQLILVATLFASAGHVFTMLTDDGPFIDPNGSTDKGAGVDPNGSRVCYTACVDPNG